MSYKDVTHPDEVESNVEQFAALVRGEIPVLALEKRYVNGSGATIWGHATVSVQRDAARNPLHPIRIIQDVPEQKRLEAQLPAAKAAAESASRAKDEFLANVSHEIRTPMNAVLGLTELVLDTPLADDQRQLLETVASAGTDLLGIMNDLLDFCGI